MTFARTFLAAGVIASVAAPACAEGAASHVMNFDDVELNTVIADVSSVTGYTFIVHPDARTKRITLMSAAPLTRDQVFDVFLSSLRVQGFTAVPAGASTYRIVPEESAIGDAGLRAYSANGFVTEVIPLAYADTNEAARLVKTVTDAQGQVVANPQSRTIVVVDYASNMKRVRELVAKIDRDPSVVETIALRNVPAREMAQILVSLAGGPSNDGTPSAFRAVASDSGNSVVLYGTPAAVSRAREVCAQLDQTDRQDTSLKVVVLNNSDAEDLVPILQQMADAMDARRGFGAATGDVPLTTIAQHKPTNSIVMSAPPETLAALERVIADLDRRRAQVLVEAIIVEMSDDTARELGLQFLLSGTGDSTIPFMSTNFSRSAPNLLALAGALVKDNPLGGSTSTTGGNLFTQAAISSLLGLEGLTIGAGGQDGNALFGAVLNAVERDGASRVLSKPFNMTLDHGKSSLLVGQEVPIATGEVLGDSNSNPFRTVDRKKIGIGLEVTPKIANDGTIRLDIRQEVSNIAGSVGVATTDLVFNTREIETSVIADDGEIIVLGGLTEQQEDRISDKVPVLGDIPVAGRLFRSEGKAMTRTNLMVFLRPTIVRDQAGADEVTRRSYRYIRAEELWDGADDAANSLDTFMTQVLGSPPPQ
jgi:general secretion pathway protein D